MLKGINYHVHFEMWERELSFVSRKITYQLTISLLKRETNETVTSKKKIIFYLITDIRQSSVKWGPLTDLSPFCPSLTQLYLWFFFPSEFSWVIPSYRLPPIPRTADMLTVFTRDQTTAKHQGLTDRWLHDDDDQLRKITPLPWWSQFSWWENLG